MNTRPTPSVVTDDGLVERFRANILVSSNIRGGALNHFEDYEIRAIIRAALAASDRDVLVEAAWREGWSTGYRSGMTDGGSDSCWCDEAGDWEKSKARSPHTFSRRAVTLDSGRNPALALRAVPLYGVTALTRIDRA